MGLFKRKRDAGIIDMGDGNVAVSPERVDEMADQTIEWIFERYEEPVSAEISDAIGIAVEGRHLDPDLSGTLKSLLASAARMGYGARQSEDGLDSIRSDTPMLTNEIRAHIEAGESTAGALAKIALTWCDVTDDPASRAGFDAIEGLGRIREKVCEKTVLASARLAAEMGLAEPGELPPGVDLAEMLAVWRIGFLIRSCELSLPEDVTLTADEERSRHIVVDAWAVKAAMNEWADENPEATVEEAEQAGREIAEHPRFRVDPSEMRDDGEARYSVFEVDQTGRIIGPED